MLNIKNFKTPRYIIDLEKFRENSFEISTAFEKEWGNNIEFGYSVKTNRDCKLIQYAHDNLKWNIEVVSPDEYYYVRSLGIEESCIILNGPCKLGFLKDRTQIPGMINLDNYDEVCEFVAGFPYYKGCVGLRVNFDLESKCPGETTAAGEVSRFGIDTDSTEFLQSVNLLKKNGISNIGLHLHTSTKSRSLKVFSELSKKAVSLKEETDTEFSFIDIGGGFFGGQRILGKPTMDEYAKTICDILKKAYDVNKTKLVLEPGASVLATCVTYETIIINKRIIRGVTVLTVDGTLLHINPFMHSRTQPFIVLSENFKYRNRIKKQVIGGSTCMENDRLAIVFDTEELRVGDILSFKYVGAYTMAFNSNFIINPPCVEYIERTSE